MAAVVWACWIVVAVVWAVGAIYNAVKGPATRQRAPGRLPIVATALAAWLLLRDAPDRIAHSLTVHWHGVAWAGVVVVLASTGLALWARGALGRMWSSTPMTKEGHELRTTGPYSLVRHPIYTGLLGMVAGTALANGFGVWGLILLASVAALEFKIRSEERLMGAEFPDQYPAYRRRVPQLVPGLYLIPGLRPQ